MPAAKATTFLSAAPSSIPSTSELVYTRNTSLINRLCIYSAVSFFLEPTTIVVGMPFPTSSAWEGPESTATSALGISCSIISDKVIRVTSSIPLATFTIFCPSFMKGAILPAVLLVKGEGTASTSRSLSLTALSKSVVNSISSGRITPGSLSLCS